MGQHWPRMGRHASMGNMYLENAFQDGERSLAVGAGIVKASPFWVCKSVLELPVTQSLRRSVRPLPPHQTLHQAAYDQYFDSIHPPGATLSRIDACYRKRWCSSNLINNKRIHHLAHTSCKYLRWLSKRVPPRVHIANVRFACNGWHTGRRYQLKIPCRYCNGLSTIDSIEHIVRCHMVQDLFPGTLKQGSPPEVPVSSFFLLGLDGKSRIAMALVVYALYTIHNELRHSSPVDPQEFRHAVYRILAEIRLCSALKAAWGEILQWESRGFRRCNPSRPTIGDETATFC